MGRRARGGRYCAAAGASCPPNPREIAGPRAARADTADDLDCMSRAPDGNDWVNVTGMDRRLRSDRVPPEEGSVHVCWQLRPWPDEPPTQWQQLPGVRQSDFPWTLPASALPALRSDAACLRRLPGLYESLDLQARDRKGQICGSGHPPV
jgi:hypothetical protein